MCTLQDAIGFIMCISGTSIVGNPVETMVEDVIEEVRESTIVNTGQSFPEDLGF
jgi:hypothetical protein